MLHKLREELSVFFVKRLQQGRESTIWSEGGGVITILINNDFKRKFMIKRIGILKMDLANNI